MPVLTLASIAADLEAVETAARGRGSLACDHLATRLTTIRGDLQRIAAPQPPAEAQGGGEVVAWRILWSPQFPETAELTSDGERVQKVRVLDGSPKIEPLYTTPPSAPVGVEGLIAKWRRYADGNFDDAANARSRCADDLEALAQQPAAGIFGRIRKTPEYALEKAGLEGYLQGLADQQPAAVDGAMVARFLEAYRDTPGDEAIDADEKVARRWLTAALELQQGGRSDV